MAATLTPTPTVLDVFARATAGLGEHVPAERQWEGLAMLTELEIADVIAAILDRRESALDEERARLDRARLVLERELGRRAAL